MENQNPEVKSQETEGRSPRPDRGGQKSGDKIREPKVRSHISEPNTQHPAPKTHHLKWIVLTKRSEEAIENKGLNKKCPKNEPNSTLPFRFNMLSAYFGPNAAKIRQHVFARARRTLVEPNLHP